MPALVLDLAASPVKPILRSAVRMRSASAPLASGASLDPAKPEAAPGQSPEEAPEATGAFAGAALLELRIQAIRYEAEGILSFDLADPEGRALPAFTAGAHIDLHLPNGLLRQYSLCGDPAERRRYSIAVLKEAAGRGGSQAVHESLRCGQTVTVSVPRNHFPLEATAERHLLLAGGIGVTPMMAMMAELEARGADYELHYCTRTPGRTAFRESLQPRVASGRARLHHDEGDPARGLDIAALLKTPQAGTHLYFCGPAGFMAAVKAASAHWPEEAVHFEYFAAPAEGVEGDRAADGPFQIRLASTDEVFDVPAGKSIVDVLRENDVHVDTSCRDGYCGTCLTRFTQGEPDHRDTVLDKKDRQEFLMICCSRSKSPLLVLDL